MNSDERRILKLVTMREIKFYGVDQDGDIIFVDLDKRTSQQILDFIKNAILDQTTSRPLMIGG